MGRHTELAGERAARVLPAVFALAEGCVEALAADSMHAEAYTDVSAEDDDMVAPVLSDRQASHPLRRIEALCRDMALSDQAGKLRPQGRETQEAGRC